MSEPSAEQFAQRCFDLGLLSTRQLEAVWGDLGTRDIECTRLRSLLLRKELLTNYQIDRVLQGERNGYFYGEYKVLYLVGTGTFARVYRATHRVTGAVMAVKVLRKRFRDNNVEVDQFMREGEMGRVLQHPCIVTIHEIQKERNAPYLVLDFIEGQNLRDFLRSRKKIEPAIAVSLMEDVAAGLAYAQSKGITHRDLKLSNVLVTAQGRGKLLDFGLASFKDHRDDNSLAECPNPRTIDYAGLERATGVRKDDPRSDVYFAGCILYHMLSGVAPLFETRDRIQRLSITRFQDIAPVSDVEPSIPRYLAAVVNRAMDLNPKRRFQTPDELLAELVAVRKRLKEGEVAASSAAEAGEATSSHGLEGSGKTLLVVETNTALQNALREKLKRFGYKVLVIGDPERALARFRPDEPPPADCVLFGAAELGSSALDAFNRFGAFARTQDVPAILLVNESQSDIARQAEVARHRVLVSMPIKFAELRQVIRELLEKSTVPKGK